MKALRSLAVLVVTLGAAAAQVPGWQSYSGAGFTISIPPGWKADPAFLDKGYAFFQGQTDDVRGGTAFMPAADIAPGTTLQSDQLKLVVQRARPGDLCTAAAFLVDPPPDYETHRLVDKPELARTIADPGDLYTVEQAVILVSKAPCVAVHYYIAYARPRRGDLQAPFDRDGLFKLLGAMAASVKITK